MIPNIQTDPEGVFFIPFLKPKTQLEKCERWIKNCGRPKEQFNISRVTKDTFICSKNFVGGNGPTVDHPDPIPATAIGEQVRKFCKPPQLTSTPQKKKRLDTDDMMAAEALVDMSVIRHAADFSQKIKESFEISELPQKVTSATQTEPVLIVPITEDYQKLNASSQTVVNTETYEMKGPNNESQWNKRPSLITSANKFGKIRLAMRTLGQWNSNPRFKENHKYEIPPTTIPRAYVSKKNDPYQDVSKIDLEVVTKTECAHSKQDNRIVNSNINACRQPVHGKSPSTNDLGHNTFSSTLENGIMSSVYEQQQCRMREPRMATADTVLQNSVARFEYRKEGVYSNKILSFTRSKGSSSIIQVEGMYSSGQSFENSDVNSHSEDYQTSGVEIGNQKYRYSISTTSQIAQSLQPHLSRSSSSNGSFRKPTAGESSELPWFVEYCRMLIRSPTHSDDVFELSPFESETQSKKSSNHNWVYWSSVELTTNGNSDDEQTSCRDGDTQDYRYSVRRSSQDAQSQQPRWSHTPSPSSLYRNETEDELSELPWFVNFCRNLDSSPVSRDAILGIISWKSDDTASWFDDDNPRCRCSVPRASLSTQAQWASFSCSSTSSDSYKTAPEQASVELKSRSSGKVLPIQTLSSTTVPVLGMDDVIFEKNAANERIVLGEGVFGYVCLATLSGTDTEKKVVVKEFTDESTDIYEVLHEARILLHLEETNMVQKCFGIMPSQVEPSGVALVQECIGVGMTLQRLLCINPPAITHAGWLDISYQLAMGLDQIYKKFVLLNDIKIDNVLIDYGSQGLKAKFIDMGYATFKEPFIFGGPPEDMEPYVYLAPEVRQCGHTSTKSDVYSLGYVFHDMIRKVGCTRLSAVSELCKLRRPEDRPSTKNLIDLISVML
ncbi:hypothetical protein ScPMuIL_010936 [Solemya velum]